MIYSNLTFFIILITHFKFDLQAHQTNLFKLEKAHFHQFKFINLSIQILILFLFYKQLKYLFGLKRLLKELSLIQYFIIKHYFRYILILMILKPEAIRVNFLNLLLIFRDFK